MASHLLDEVEKVCTHVVILRKGKKLYSGQVNEMISSHGFFEMKSNQMEGLLEFLETQPNIAYHKEENGLVTAFLNEPLDSEIFIKLLFENKIILTHFIKRKQSLEEQFLQLTDNK